MAGIEPTVPSDFYGKQSNSGQGEVSGSGSGGGGGGGVINNTQAAQQILTYLQGQGINAAQVFFPSNGQLLVRAPLADLDLIEQAIEILNTSPEQLYIEAKFAELNLMTGNLGFTGILETPR